MYTSKQKESKTENNLSHAQRNMTKCPTGMKMGIYNGVPFCSLIQDHQSWGASVEKNKKVNFKIATFSDAKNVSVELKAKGEEPKIIPLKNKGEGVFQSTVNPDVAKAGDRYRFLIDREGKKIEKVRDPYSMKQDSLSQWSIIYDHNDYDWKDTTWMKNKNDAKISRRANAENHLKPISDLKIYEAHIGTMTDEGSFEAAKKQLDKIAKDKKFNAVEFMPVENTYGYNWGYDGVDKFAPNHTMGDPDKLKELIDHAHSLNLNVIMDMVPNHLGPDIPDLQNAGPYTDGTNAFGYKMNYERCDNKYVREYISNAALNWATNYHCDGLRLDMTKFMDSDFTMKQIVAELNYHSPDTFLIAEDGRDNDARVTRPFSNQEKYENQHEHCAFIGKIANNQVSLENLGFDSEWDFPFHKQIASSVLGSWDGRYRNMENLDYAVKHSGMRVKYPMSHDEIGNIDGTRLVSKLFQKEMNLFYDVEGDTPAQKGQRTAHASHNVVKSLLTGRLDDMNSTERQKFYRSNHIKKNLDINVIKDAYERSIKQHRLAVGMTYSVPGPKMIFQGDEEGNQSYFKFFRKFSTGYEKYLEDKGYEPGEKAFLDSKLNSVKVADKYKHYISETAKYTEDLNNIMAENPALESGVVVNTVTHPLSELHATHCKKDKNEIFSISNFKNEAYYKDYGIQFPRGKWVEISNTDDKKYGGSGDFKNDVIISDGKKTSDLSIPEYGMIYFKKVD
ncbi:MAG: alpha-amylase family glycosyl hydrolase [Candidatus Gastranaerophilales bacterium]|nr:alpha-amylase family glycosyl hydrolase [Candidatus Gastranaerophilales bacterium]